MEKKIVKSHWFDLLASNMEDARSFYEGLFGWTFLRLQNSPFSDYWAIQTGQDLIGGLRPRDLESGPGHGPVLYFTVDHLDPYTKRVKELGGYLVGERVDLGDGRGSYQWFRDRQDNLVSLWAPQ